MCIPNTQVPIKYYPTKQEEEAVSRWFEEQRRLKVEMNNSKKEILKNNKSSYKRNEYS